MNLRTRITATVMIVSAVGTLVVGSLAINWLRMSQIDGVDSNLSQLVLQIERDADDAVDEATLAVDESAMPTGLAFAAVGTETAWLRTLPNSTEPPLSRADAVAAADAAVTTSDGYRLRSIALANEEYLVFVASLAAINQESRNNFARLLLLWLPFNGALAAVISYFVSRNVRQMEQLVAAASNIAAGAADVDIPSAGRTNEARTLASALDRLVLSLQHALETERDSNRRMQEFLGDASHELRTPLTVIKGYLELLGRPDALQGEQQDRALDRMRAESERMEALINDLLFLAEIGSTPPEDRSIVDLTTQLRLASEDLRALQPSRSITTEIEADVAVRMVPSHLQRAIANAIGNVHRHTPADAPVFISLRQDARDVVFSIEDGGAGLPDETYRQGISHFRRFDKSRSRATGGSGLGMSIIAAVMREAGGSVELRKSALGGLALDFRIPHMAD